MLETINLKEFFKKSSKNPKKSDKKSIKEKAL